MLTLGRQAKVFHTKDGLWVILTRGHRTARFSEKLLQILLILLTFVYKFDREILVRISQYIVI